VDGLGSCSISMDIKALENILGVSEAGNDGLKVGSPKSEITGVAVTWMATRRIVMDAAQRGLNLLISHQPVFYHPTDDFKDAEADFAFVEKMQELLRNSILLYRLHDLCVGHPDFCFSESLAACIGFGEPMHSVQGIATYVVVPDSLHDIATIVRQRLEASEVRILGEQESEISRIATMVAKPSVADLRQCMKLGAKCVIAAEANELAIGYAADSNLALILCAEIHLARPGLRKLSEHLRAHLTGIPIELIEPASSLTIIHQPPTITP